MKITTICGDYSYSQPYSQVADKLQKKFKGSVEMVNHFCLRHQVFTENQLDEMERDVSQSDIVLLWMVFDDAIIKILETHANQGKTYLILASVPEGMKLASLGKFSISDIVDSFANSPVAKVFALMKGLSGKSSTMEVRKMLTMADSILKILRFGKWKDAANYVQVWKYVFNGGKDNLLNMFLMLLAEYHDIKTKYDPPIEVPAFFLSHPRCDKTFTSVTDYLAWYEKSEMPKGIISKNGKPPMVGILFYQQRYQNDDCRDLDLVVKNLEDKGIGVIPAMTSATENLKAFQEFFINGDGCRVDAIVSFLFFRLEGGPLGGAYEAFEALCRRMDVPLINYIFMG